MCLDIARIYISSWTLKFNTSNIGNIGNIGYFKHNLYIIIDDKRLTSVCNFAFYTDSPLTLHDHTTLSEHMMLYKMNGKQKISSDML